jgi:hypothetical protein
MQVFVTALLTIVLGHAASSPSPITPYVLKAEPQGMSFGLLYTPEVLSGLVANNPPDTVRPRIAEAIREGDAIVAMWTLPRPPVGALPRPYKIAVVNYNPAIDVRTVETPWNIPDRIDPKWIEQDAADLAQIDPRDEFRDVAAMATCSREVFVPGRRLYVWLGPQRQPDSSLISQSRWAVIEWNGGQRVVQRRLTDGSQ